MFIRMTVFIPGDLEVFSYFGDHSASRCANLGRAHFGAVKTLVDTSARTGRPLDDGRDVRTLMAVELKGDGDLDLASTVEDDGRTARYVNDQKGNSRGT